MEGFICPICGGTDFGTIVDSHGVTTRHCHGWLPELVAGKRKPCLFHWRVEDDAQYLSPGDNNDDEQD